MEDKVGYDEMKQGGILTLARENCCHNRSTSGTITFPAKNEINRENAN